MMDMYKSSILVPGYMLLIAGGHGEWPTLKLCADSLAIMVKMTSIIRMIGTD